MPNMDNSTLFVNRSYWNLEQQFDMGARVEDLVAHMPSKLKDSTVRGTSDYSYIYKLSSNS